MKKAKFAVMAVLFLLVTAAVPCGFADSQSPSGETYQWNQKMGRGFLNIVSSPLEIPREINFISNEKNLGVGWTLGFFQGFGVGLVRFGSGVIDLVTSPFTWPDSQRAPLIQPEYPWEDARTKI